MGQEVNERLKEYHSQKLVINKGPKIEEKIH